MEPLAPLTTFRIGGPARVLIEAHTEEDIETGLTRAREAGLPFYVLGAGSNILVPDAGVEGVVIHMRIRGLVFEDAGSHELLIAGAGALWDEAVRAAVARGLFGIENLAGIPGTLGGVVVQNIGAYGAELSSIFAYADVIDATDGTSRRVSREEAVFAYRDSFFKRHRELIIVRVALRLAKQGMLNTTYADVARGGELTTPSEVAEAIRFIRAGKFPSSAEGGTAGSFFKNPIVTEAEASELATRFPGLPVFAQADGRVKLSLAWLLDHALSLKGYAHGRARLYEKQPLILVAQSGATAIEVDALAHEVAARVLAATGITIEREVEMFGVH